MTNVTLIPGDGIGPEIAASLVDIFKAANVSIKFDIENAGIDIYNKTPNWCDFCADWLS